MMPESRERAGEFGAFPYLQVRFASGETRRHPLVAEVTSIGRSDEASLSLPDFSISRLQAKISRRGDSFVIEDFGSSNGTFVNDVRIDSPRPLGDGDEIRIGTVVALFRVGGSVDVESPSVDLRSLDAGQGPSAAEPVERAEQITGVAGDVFDSARASAMMIPAGDREALGTAVTGVYDQLNLAREIQSFLLPRGSPDISGYLLAADMQPSLDVGGDFYDYVIRPDGALAIIVGDVARKGIGAALMGHYTQALFRSALDYELWLDRVLAKVNRDLHQHCAPHQFVTACLCVLEPSSGDLFYANAGHCAPLLLGPDGSVRSLREGGVILGILGDARYSVGRVVLEPGGVLALFSDGLIECCDASGREFGIDSLVDFLRLNSGDPPLAIVAALKRELRRFAAGSRVEDDVTVVILQRLRPS